MSWHSMSIANGGIAADCTRRTSPRNARTNSRAPGRQQWLMGASRPVYAALVIIAIFILNYLIVKKWLVQPINGVLEWRDARVRDRPRVGDQVALPRGHRPPAAAPKAQRTATPGRSAGCRQRVRSHVGAMQCLCGLQGCVRMVKHGPPSCSSTWSSPTSS